ncbi:hypothetical protein SAMN05216262_105166 [Colwellia chukchiensis]|uniref:Uncharacterized protein n=1 Tax=Colwellia chukchiensis TaxID=641665 RepID=A0A1H7MAU8_9GAMM|nr:hypothetical protein [Colwellia chukchiensis]SEL08313.1 hypothetical protein SAMN05216262_105166 [Colwellia chukchiensis]
MCFEMPNKALVPEKISASLQNFRRARRYEKDDSVNREDMTKLTTTALTFPIVFLLVAYFYDEGTLSILSFLSYLLLAVVGSLIGAVYAYYGHNWFFKNSFVAGFIPSVVLIIISRSMGLDDLVELGDLCLIIACWTTASEVAFIKNKTV